MFDRAEMNMPVMNLELRIEPIIRQMVHKMLLSEEEAKAAIEDAVSSAIVAFDWRAQIRKQVEESLQHEVRKVLENVGRRLLWDDEIQALIKTRVVKALSAGDGEKGQP